MKALVSTGNYAGPNMYARAVGLGHGQDYGYGFYKDVGTGRSQTKDD